MFLFSFLEVNVKYLNFMIDKFSSKYVFVIYNNINSFINIVMLNVCLIILFVWF